MVEQQFKNTELGKVPTDWEGGRFEDFMNGFSSGMTPYRGNKDFYNGDIPWITSGELNYNIIRDTLEKITPDAVSKTNLKIIPTGTFLIAITGLEAEGTRGSCAITGIDAATNQSCMALYPHKDKLLTSYLYHFYVRYGNELAFRYCQGTKQQSYNAVTAKKLPIVFPSSLPEQQAIVDALTHTDEWIESLGKLIAKKRLMKQAAMQQLFTPKSDWVAKRLRDIGKTYGGLSGKTRKDFGIGSAFYLPFLNIIQNVVIDKRRIEKVSLKQGEFQNRVLINDILFNGSSETPEELGISSVMLNDIDDLYLNSFSFGFRLFDEKINPLFFSYLMRSPYGRSVIFFLAQGATRYNLSKSNFLELEISFPSIESQIYIASMLSDIDSEIQALEQKFSKAQQIKQGMMQELLTGRIRLIETHNKEQQAKPRKSTAKP